MNTVSIWSPGQPGALSPNSIHLPIVPTWPAKTPTPTEGIDDNRSASTGSSKRKSSVGTLRAALFELDNVLYDATHWQRWLWQLLARMGVQRDFESFHRIWQSGYLVEAQRGDREFADVFRSFLVDWGLSAGRVDEVEAASSARRREMFEQVRPLPGVVKAIQRLHDAGIVLGVLANSELPATDLKDRIERLGLAGRFQIVLSSRDLGCVKPEPAAYQSALDALRFAPASVAFVSCRADDLTGAAAVGLRTISVYANAAASHADHCLARFDELPAICLPENSESACR